MHENRENKYQKKILTIPNALSFIRICLVPIIVWLYICKENYFGTLMILILSVATDVIDGIIARKFHMISDFGKAFDPFADKLTQAATLFCLCSRFTYMWIPLCLLIIKEVFTGITALISIRKTDIVEGAVWHGKLTTVSLYLMMSIHLIWFHIPLSVSLILVGLCLAIMMMSFLLYTAHNISNIKYKS